MEMAMLKKGCALDILSEVFDSGAMKGSISHERPSIRGPVCNAVPAGDIVSTKPRVGVFRPVIDRIVQAMLEVAGRFGLS